MGLDQRPISEQRLTPSETPFHRTCAVGAAIVVCSALVVLVTMEVVVSREALRSSTARVNQLELRLTTLEQMTYYSSETSIEDDTDNFDIDEAFQKLRTKRDAEPGASDEEEPVCPCGDEIRLLKTYFQHVKSVCLHSKTAHLIPSPVGTTHLAPHRPIQWTASHRSTEYAYPHNELFDIQTGSLRVRLSGYYLLYVHLTFAGRTNASRTQHNVHCAFVTEVQKSGLEPVTLMTNVQTQLERGYFLEYDQGGTAYYPYDDSHQSSIFLLMAGDQLRVRPGTQSPYCRLVLAPTKTHMGAVLLEPLASGRPTHG